MTNSYAFKFILFSFVLLTVSIPAFADVKIKTKQTAAGQTTESTVYIKGKRQRTESAAGASVSIMQCDLRRNVQVMPQAQAYTISPFDTPDEKSTTTVVDKNTTKTVTKGSTITTTITTKDTGERKQMFGYTARHIITTIESVSSPDACSPVNTKMQQDGWYIDAAFALSCEQNKYSSYVPPTRPEGCQDKVQTRQIGAAKTGYALLEKMTMFDESGKESFSMTSEVVELSQATLNAALFDVPADFREIKEGALSGNSMAVNLGGGAQMSIGGNGALSGGAMPNMPNVPNVSNVSNGTGNGGNYGASDNYASGGGVKNLGGKTSNASTTVGEKRAGIVRIGLAQVKIAQVGEGMNAPELAAAVGNSLAEYLKSPNVEIVQLEARLASQIDGEAQRKACDFVVYANVSHKKGGGGGFGGMFGKAAGGMLGSVIPMAGGIGGAIAGAVVSTAVVTAANASSNVKAKDEITIEYKLVQPGSQTPTVANTLKGKAKSSGEDIITPLIEQAATQIMNVVSAAK